ncbi:MAG: hypothetical protein Q4F49_07790 [Pseudoxanthomonas suwonensis]|nr:hypothetical protein [Pseudoxanthomonas suwonensis]
MTTSWLLRPTTVTTLVLDRVGAALGLEITAAGIGEYRLRGSPQLVVRDVIARQPDAEVPVLRAERILLSLPWTTLRSRGRDLTITHVELDRPVLDLQALSRWQASRPPTAETRIPTLTDGLTITEGRVQGQGWAFAAIHARLPRLAPEQPVRADLAARFEDAGTRVAFELALAMSAPAAGAGIAAIGPLSIIRDAWRIDGAVHLRRRLANADGGVGLTPATVGYAGSWRGTGDPLSFQLGLHGPFAFRDGIWRYGWQRLHLRGDPVVPALDAAGAIALGRQLALRVNGAMPEWPAGWPALPAPLHASDTPLAVAVDYVGPADLSATTTLGLRRDTSTFDGRLRLPQMLDWADRAGDPAASPLPPMQGEVNTPRLEIGGIRMEGVRIRIDED